tara:strand:- start:4640 stop:5131 length:492 start_codon:yes stop_codon:yes gene_type:complete
MNNFKVIPAIAEVLLHSGNMRLLDRVIDFDSEFAVTEYTPLGNAWYADDNGNMPVWVGLELMAQTISAHAGLLKYDSGKALKHGALLGTRSYSVTTPFFEANQPLYIQVAMVYRDESGLGAYDCAISNTNTAFKNGGNNVLATATLKVFEPDNFQDVLQDDLS